MPEWNLDNVLYEANEGNAWITINRPDRLNALDRKTVGEIVAAVEQAVADGEVRVIVLTGAGEKAFVAGADIKEMSTMSAAEGQEYSRFLHASLHRIEPAIERIRKHANVEGLPGGRIQFDKVNVVRRLDRRVHRDFLSGRDLQVPGIFNPGAPVRNPAKQ